MSHSKKCNVKSQAPYTVILMIKMSLLAFPEHFIFLQSFKQIYYTNIHYKIINLNFKCKITKPPSFPIDN